MVLDLIGCGEQLENRPPGKEACREAKSKSALIDASSAILLAKAGLLDLLTRTYRLVMALSVFHESVRPGYPGAETIKELRYRGRIAVFDAASWDFWPDPRLQTLHAGERDTIGAWLRGKADFVIIDDGKGAGFCRDNAVPYINALLVPRILVLGERISPSDGFRFTDAVLSLGRYSAKIVHVAKTCSPESLDFFLPSVIRTTDGNSRYEPPAGSPGDGPADRSHLHHGKDNAR